MELSKGDSDGFEKSNGGIEDINPRGCVGYK